MPTRDIVKFIAFVIMLGSVYLLLLDEHPFLRWAAVAYAVIVAGATVDRHYAIHGDEENPGLLPSMSILLPIFGMVLVSGVPALLHDIGFRPSWRFDWYVLMGGFLSGAFLALLHWIPFTTYLAIDLVCDRIQPRQAI